MSDDINRSSLLVSLTDVNGKILRDTVEFKFYNVRLTSEKLRATINLKGRPVRIRGLPAVPNGLTQVFISPTNYRFKSVFENVPSDGSGHMNEVFFVDPDKVTPEFPTFTEIKREAVWAELARLLRESGIASATDWRNLEDLPKAGLLNLYSKMQATFLEGGESITKLVRSVDEFQPARMLARVDPNLMDLVAGATNIFHGVSGTLHFFQPPWEPVSDENSWKTFDSAGNLQLTFATDRTGNFLADIDIDDHQGIEHAADVLKHVFSGTDTHPYDIHEILIFFQHLDPGYALA